MNELEIYEKFAEWAGIQEFEQKRTARDARNDAWDFTLAWLIGEGFERKQANTMIRKAIRKYENNC